jgi:S1-C subfamily serine protease
MLDDPGVRQAAPSIVRVVSASGVSGSAGSGWVAASELVVTNAHVIADADYIVVQPEGVGEQLEAEVLIFDERNDLAVLGVEGWISPPWNSPSPSPASPSPSSVTRKTSSVVEEAIRAAEQQRARAATTGCVSVETLMSFKGSSHARREDY